MDVEQLCLFDYMSEWLESPLYARAIQLLDDRNQHELEHGVEVSAGPGELPENRRYSGKNVWIGLTVTR